jgi:Type I phosphodiesterase / nucleotide pyrophosphatase
MVFAQAPHTHSRSACAGWLALLAGALTVCCSPLPRGRVLLVGIDGASARILTPLLDAGALPTLAALARNGHAGPLRAQLPLFSPRIWTSIATGVDPRRHGIAGFARRDARGGLRLYQSGDRRVPALWNIASDVGLSVVVVNWWNSYPAEPLRGAVVSDHVLAAEIEGRRKLTGAAPPEPAAVAWPPALGPRLVPLLQDDSALTEIANPFVALAPLPTWVQRDGLVRRFENDADIARIALALEAELHPDLMLVFLPGIDRVSHVLWGAIESPEAYGGHPPRMDAAQRKAMASALRRYYVYTDALLGRFLQRYGASDLVLVVSDHGFEAGRALGFLSGVHQTARARDGVIFARGPGVGKAASGAPPSVNDVTPSVLAWLGLPVADDMDGRVAPFLSLPHVAHIGSYAAGWKAPPPAAPTDADRALLAELRALGYMDDARSASTPR